MTKEEIKQLEERVYAIGNSLFPIDAFFNDIRDNKDPRYNKDRAYKDLKLIVDKLQELVDKEKPKRVIKFTSEITNSEEAYTFYTCPKCRILLSNDIYCPKCGQHLDWSDEDE